MADPLVASLAGEEIVESNSLAIVTTGWVIVRPVRNRARVVLSLDSITNMQRVRTSHPGLLVIASGLILIAAAAYYSKDSSPAAVPIAVLGLFFAAAFWGTRRSSVVFHAEQERVETGLGSFGEASELVRAVTTAQLQASHEAEMQ